ncbi:hypothetical protein LguiB_017459 [Lonicera macranthoides]
MEESAKRRERLKAMREEASSLAAVCNSAEDRNVSHGLSNPLIEISATNPVQGESNASQRFDYYTDPMSAFSGNKRRSKVSPQTSQDHFIPPRLPVTEMLPSPTVQPQMNYSSNQQMYQAQGPTYFPSNSPRGANFPSPNLNTGQGRGPWLSNSPGPGGGVRGGFSGGSPGFQTGGSSPSYNTRQGRGQWFNNNPGPGGSPSFNPVQGRGHWFNNSPVPGGTGSNPGFRQGSSPSFNPQQGRGNRFNSSGYGLGRGGNAGPSSGGTRWLGNNLSPGSGRGGGRGRGSHTNVSAEQRPDLYYNKSMVEDPWKFLEPIVWRRENIPSLNTPLRKSWLPESVSVKKVRVEETKTDSSSKQSLAEYLATSFNEAVNDESGK